MNGGKEMKKSILLVLSLLLVLTFLSACSEKKEPEKTGKDSNAVESESDISGKITFLTNRTDMIGKQYDDYKKRFEEKYPNVQLEFEAIQDYDQTLKVRMNSGDFPDVVFLPTLPNSEFPEYFASLNDIEFSGDIYFKELRSFEGEMYGVSSGASTVGIVYNKEAFQKAGITEVPKTYDEFLAASEKLKAQGIVPLASNFKDKWPLDAWVYDVPTIISGKSDHQQLRADTDTPYTMDNEYGKAWSILRELNEKGYLEPDINSTNWEQSKKDVATGKFGMYLLGNWVINQVIENGAAPENIGFFPFPADNSGVAKAPLNPDYFYAVNKNGNVAAAKAFIKWMIEESGYDDFAGFIPTLKDKEPQLAQLAEFNSYNVQFIEPVQPSDLATAIQNNARLDQGSTIQEFVLSDNPQSVLDAVNQSWAKARKDTDAGQ